MEEILLLILILIIAILIYKCGNKVIQMVGGALMDETKEPTPKKYAVCTLVMKGSSYSSGALVLAQSIKKYAPECDTIVMITPDVDDEAKADLEKVFTSVRRVEYLNHKSRTATKRQDELYSDWVNSSFSKWLLLDYDEYDKILWMDADTIAVQPLAELFKMKSPAIVISSPWARPLAKNGIPNPIGHKKHGDRVTCVETMKMLKNPSSGYLGGVVLLSPKKGLVDKLKAMLNRYDVYPPLEHKSMIFADEQAIAQLMCEDNQEWTALGGWWNYMLGKTALLEGKKPCVLHFYHNGPWIQARDAWPDLEIWYKHADELVAQYPELDRWFPHRIKDSEASKAAFLKAEEAKKEKEKKS